MGKRAVPLCPLLAYNLLECQVQLLTEWSSGLGDPGRNVFFVLECLYDRNLREEWVCLSNFMALSADNL